MAKCFDVTGYVEPCNVVRQKYTGRALLITGHSGGETLQNSITFEQNGIVIEEMYGASTFQTPEGFVAGWTEDGGKALLVKIDVQNPFGVTIQGNTDTGRVMYTKTIPVSIPATRDGKAEEFIMGLQKGLHFSAAIILETFGNDDMNNTNQNEIFGTYSPVRIDPTSVTRNEYENGGAWSFNLVCEEPVPNVICMLEGFSYALDDMEGKQQTA